MHGFSVKNYMNQTIFPLNQRPFLFVFQRGQQGFLRFTRIPHYGCEWDASLRDVMLHVISLVKLHCQWVSSRGHMRLSVDCNM